MTNESNAAASARPSDVSEKLSSVTGDIPPVILKQALSKMTDEQLSIEIRSRFRKTYNQEARELQVQSVVALARNQPTFLIAGTGYGKTRIAESFRGLFSVKSLAIVLVLNPLDALGDNQVNFTAQVAKDIEKGVYSFIYLSPEIFLTHRTWEKIYNSLWFRRRLILKVVDEAHMIYSWGLVSSGRAKNMSTFKREQDSGKFRPSWGNLCLHLMASRRSPLLMMSATCPHPHFDLIIKSLSIKRQDMTVLKGELCRPEIRLLRISTPSLGSLDFLKDHFAKKSETPDADVVPTLVYSGSRNGTMRSLMVMNDARGTIGDEFNPDSTFGQRYHSCSGEQTKLVRLQAYTDREFPVIACTSALGLGQNWTHTRMVIQIGRAGVPEITQVVGRVGRNKSSGLAIIYLEDTRKGGLNSIEAFDGLTEQTDDQMMDALRWSKVCLRVILVLANTQGFIPMYPDHEYVQKEVQRQQDEGFPPCGCEICEPEACSILVQNLNLFRLSNFEEGLRDPKSLNPKADYSSLAMNARAQDRIKRGISRKRKMPETQEIDDVDLLDLMYEINEVFSDHFDSIYKGQAPFPPSALFGPDHLRKIIDHMNCIDSEEDLSECIGGDAILGGNKLIFKTISDWKSDSRGYLHFKRIGEEKKKKDLNARMTLERLEQQDIDRTRKHQQEATDRKKLVVQKAEKTRELEVKNDEKKQKKELANLKKKKEEDRVEREKAKDRDARMLQWLKHGVRSEDLDHKESTYQRSIISSNPRSLQPAS